ncbi:MAG: putative phosphoglycerate mutase family protein [Satyrvirus sp.]|uniref:Putative phosphoglycerate mutase family protein n=1 Tax=Satyrvirus sp. TaxID=2487771 RepID=A0A3G5AE99_9VIRU|nr:MAG: putative phosphoglycerate mutase family protein [Satyrvirus sp.]
MSFPNSEILIEPLLAEHQPYFEHRIDLYPNGIPTLYDGQDTIFSYPETYNDFLKRIEFIINKLVEKK